MTEEEFYKQVEQVVKIVLKDKGLLIGQYHLGEVDSVVSQGKLKVFVDGNSTPETVSCDPDKTFNIGDHVWVVFINGNPRDKFVPSRRSVGF